MKIEENIATLYAGCGITTDSNPEKEWNETEMKTQTLGRVIDIYVPHPQRCGTYIQNSMRS